MTNLQLTLPSDIPARSTLVVGISGGCDSVALLYLLSQQNHKVFKRLVAAHVNYGLRGEESATDEALVRRFCVQQNIPLKVLRLRGFKKRIEKQKLSLQDEARKVRYSFFSRIVQVEKAWGVAVAHHLEDQAETVLDRFLRGAGAKGLTGLRDIQVFKLNNAKPLQVWRPLLGKQKEDLKEYLKLQGVNWREDRSNQKLDYRRNQIRHQILPFLKQWHPNLVESLSRMGDVASTEDSFLEQRTSEVGSKLKGRWTTKNYSCPGKAFQAMPLVFRRRWVRQVAEKLNGDARGLSFERVELILRLWAAQEKGPRDVGYGLSAGLLDGRVYLQNRGLPKR